MTFLIKNKGTIAGILLGGIGGFSYYYFVGCANGTCAITSQPLNSTAYGAVLGGLLLNLLKKTK